MSAAREHGFGAGAGVRTRAVAPNPSSRGLERGTRCGGTRCVVSAQACGYCVGMADIFDVIADPTRRDLLQVLLDRYVATDSASGELSVGEMVEKLGLSQPTVSKHLKVLRDCHLVRVREDGQHRYYSLDAEPLEAIEDWLIPFLSSDFDADNDGGAAVFTAWSGANVPAPLRRAAESLQHSSETGTSIGRAVAEASFQARTAIEDATAGVQQKVIDPIRKRLGK